VVGPGPLSTAVRSPKPRAPRYRSLAHALRRELAGLCRLTRRGRYSGRSNARQRPVDACPVHPRSFRNLDLGDAFRGQSADLMGLVARGGLSALVLARRLRPRCTSRCFSCVISRSKAAIAPSTVRISLPLTPAGSRLPRFRISTLAPLAFARATGSSRSGTERASRLRHRYCKPSYRARRLPLERPWPWSGPKRSRTNARGVRGCGLLASAGGRG
jgi:hypothetical protein